MVVLYYHYGRRAGCLSNSHLSCFWCNMAEFTCYSRGWQYQIDAFPDFFVARNGHITKFCWKDINESIWGELLFIRSYWNTLPWTLSPSYLLLILITTLLYLLLYLPFYLIKFWWGWSPWLSGLLLQSQFSLYNSHSINICWLMNERRLSRR